MPPPISSAPRQRHLVQGERIETSLVGDGTRARAARPLVIFSLGEKEEQPHRQRT